MVTLVQVSGFSGLEWWTGMVDWNGGLEWCNGTVIKKFRPFVTSLYRPPHKDGFSLMPKFFNLIKFLLFCCFRGYPWPYCVPHAYRKVRVISDL